MNRGALRALLFAVTALVFLVPAQAAKSPPPKKELGEVRERIDRLKREIENAEENKADVLDQLKQSEQSISHINRSLHALGQDQQAANATLTEAQKESNQLRAHIQSQQSVLSKLLYQQYVNGSQDTLRLALSLQNPNDISRQVAYYGYLSRSRATLITSLRHDLKQAEAAETVVREKTLELTQIQAQQQAEKRALLKEANTRRVVLTKLDKQIGARRKQVTQLERDERRLTRLVERLARVVPAKAKSKPRRAGERAKPASGDFNQLKGRMKLPVAGELANRFGSPRADTGTAWKGLFIRANTGSAVKALGPGSVVFADWLRGFGNLLIIDHGDGYMSLYGNNEAVLKQEGEQVAAGEVIATVGNSGGNPESGLYFEVRYQSRPIDPLQWVGRR
ncbi:MAG: peptidoglycan DD-metalloendopeptidase family protein [Burkholderiales bacterium]|nr:peptidoglycan DD-metalloendopeptidase family protein [Burkholderiales bacterium]